jgi:hypothetical protein
VLLAGVQNFLIPGPRQKTCGTALQSAIPRYPYTDCPGRGQVFAWESFGLASACFQKNMKKKQKELFVIDMQLLFLSYLNKRRES